MPTTAQLAAALREIKKPEGRQLEFLGFHEQAKARALTTTMLSHHVHYKSYRAVNLLYGKLAKEIGEFLDIKPTGLKLELLCDFFRPGDITNSEWILVMRPEFAEALKRAKWL